MCRSPWSLNSKTTSSPTLRGNSPAVATARDQHLLRALLPRTWPPEESGNTKAGGSPGTKRSATNSGKLTVRPRAVRRPHYELAVDERHRPRHLALELLEMQLPPAQFGHLAEPRPTRPQRGDQRTVLARSIGRRGQLHTVDRIQLQPVSATAIAGTWRAGAGANRLGEQPEPRFAAAGAGLIIKVPNVDADFESVQAFNADSSVRHTMCRPSGMRSGSRQKASSTKRSKRSGGSRVARGSARTEAPTVCSPGVPARSSNSVTS